MSVHSEATAACARTAAGIGPRPASPSETVDLRRSAACQPDARGRRPSASANKRTRVSNTGIRRLAESKRPTSKFAVRKRPWEGPDQSRHPVQDDLRLLAQPVLGETGGGILVICRVLPTEHASRNASSPPSHMPLGFAVLAGDDPVQFLRCSRLSRPEQAPDRRETDGHLTDIRRNRRHGDDLAERPKAPESGAFVVVAGAGFEPATSGL